MRKNFLVIYLKHYRIDMNYKRIRPLLFLLSPELSHNFSLKAIRLLDQVNLLKPAISLAPTVPKEVFGLQFPNPIGLAAGLDKNGDYIDALGRLGFGFIEIGTVTPKPQKGNPAPRMFRLVPEQAIINRMGFNNKGVDYLVKQLKRKKYHGILGINIGKNATTPLTQAIEDYRYCLAKVYSHASYVVVNISSPNTPGLRNLQAGDYLVHLLRDLKQEQHRLAEQYEKYTPMLVKVAPDLHDDDIGEMVQAFSEYRIDGVITTNTTINRNEVMESAYANETGGLSGQPLFEKATEVLAKFKKQLAPYNIPLIASGGIMSEKQAAMKIAAGADLIQLYTGLVFRGPELIAACCAELKHSP
jgi:dihydroorotate dehydrogenase